MPAVSVRNLSKVFRVYRRPIDLVKEVLRGAPHHAAFRALDDVSFDVAPGEVVGFIGRNGSGKSTLLRIITGTLDRTAGEVSVNGQVSAILELGTGFNPEFSGRENIYFGGLCLGMTRKQIDSRIDSIIDFSELRDFIDQPFKTYSSGMKCRLTFAVSISVNPEILIIDEALSVGDAKFQRKCFNKIEDFRRCGKTILFVSHDQNVLTSFCSRAMLLEKGRIIADDKPATVVNRYMEVLFGPQSFEQPTPTATISAVPEAQERRPFGAREGEHRFGSREAEVFDLGILDAQGRRVEVLQSGKGYVVFFYIRFHEEVPSLSTGCLIRNVRGIDLFGITNTTLGAPLGLQEKGKVLLVKVPLQMWLAAGDYFLTVGAARSDGMQYDLRNDALQFTVLGTPQLFTTSIVNLDARFSIEQVSQQAAEAGQPSVP
ncbi:MAG TPA: ABC transporter ATP-binding protein [Terracidiphilus sp.]|nr:ABC transporter ATP-binding protein [Terracidiphilus sp.]